MRHLPSLLAGCGVLLATAVLAQQLVRAQTGPLPMVSVFEGYVLAVAGIAALLAILGSLGGDRARARTRLVALVVLVLMVVRLGGELWSPGPPPATGGETELRVLTWNLEMESKPPALAVEGIAATEADVVALQELTPEYAAAIGEDEALKARYPYRILQPAPGPSGLGILARRPLINRGVDPEPRILRAGLLLADGRTLELFDVHPQRPFYRTIASVPVSMNVIGRDEDVARIRALVDALPEPGSALVAGDLNGTSTEPGLGVLDGPLTDAHTAVGTGPGFTWRPDVLELPWLAVLRIDHVLAGSWLVPLATATDCTLTGDHCRLLVTLRVTPATP